MFISKKKFNAKINQAFIKGIYYGKMLENQENFMKNNSPNNIRERYILGENHNEKNNI